MSRVSAEEVTGQQHQPVSLVRVLKDPDREPDKRPLDFAIIRRLIGYMQPHANKRNWLITCVLLRCVQLPLVAWSIGAVINGPISRGAPLWQLAAAGMAVLLLGLWTQVTFHFRYRLALELGEAVIHDLRNEVFAHLQAMPMSYFNRTKIGRVISRVTSDCEAMRIGVQDVLFVSMVGAGQMLVASLFMLYYDVVLFLVIVAMAPVLWGINLMFRSRLSLAYRQMQESFSRVTGTIAESVAGIRVTQGFAREKKNAQLFQDLVTDHAEFNMFAAKTSGAFVPLLELNSQVFVAALLLLGGYRALSPSVQMPIGDLIQFFFLANIFFSPIQILGNQYNQALTAMAGAERVFALLDSPPTWSDSPNAVALPRLEGRVEFQDVQFAYEPERPVLHDISFRVEPGQTVALVGETGSGKSSMMNLLARFYLPQQGRILLDGYDIRDITADSLTDQLAIVLQNNFLFTGTVLDNIRISRPDAPESDIHQTLAQLDCADLVNGLPKGLQTEVGERGGKLSLGQRQLICFARALLADPRLLILDEATSAVDTITEARLQHALQRLLAGRTSFVVAHRLSTIRNADLVLVLDNGRIIQRGSHRELIAQPGRYAELCQAFDGV